MDGRFRVSPPAPQTEWIDRPRLRRRLQRRFEVPVTVIVAPAGYGKTSALAQALSAAHTAGSGTDLWVQCEPADADPESFGRAVLQAGGVTDTTGPVDADRLADVLAGYAPDDVCLILDDAHRIAVGSRTWQLLDDLIERLPWNAHVVLSGRTDSPCALAQRRAAGEVEQLVRDDLEFDDDELFARWTERDESSPAALGEAARWPALAALAACSPATGPVEFMVEELTPAWDSDRFAALAALAHLRDIDDDTAVAASAGPTTAAELLADLPLVQRSPGGTFQLHDLWRQALTDPATWGRRAEPAGDAVRAALTRVAGVRFASSHLLEAADLYAAAGDGDGLVRTALAFAEQPFVLLTAADLDRLAATVRTVLGDHVAADLLAPAQSLIGGHERAAAEGFEAVARRAAVAGVHDVEALALQRAANMRSIVDPDTIPPWIAERADVLAAQHPSAAMGAVMVRHHVARSAGRSDEAAAVLRTIMPPSNDRELVTFCFGMIDIGRPEEVDAFDLDGGVLRIDVAAGLWLRGDVEPETAFELGSGLVTEAESGGFAFHAAQTNAVLTLIAISAGRIGDARRFADTAMQRCSATASIPVHAFALLADALCVFCERGESAAVPLIDATLARLPIGRWPGRPYLWALPSVYVLAPSTRATLRQCRFGHALTTALDAGVALVALRDHADPAPATRLAWDRVDLLRAHVLPPHLAELAAAASATGVTAAGRLLDVLPAAREHLAGVADSPHGATAEWAAARIATMPARPADDLYVDVLGPLRLRRGATTVNDADWVKRERVRELLAYLALHRRAQRRAVAEALWPDLDPDRGMHNLRVNLTHLQRALQPGRPSGEPPWFVRADGEWLELATDGVVVDADRFDHHLRKARQLDHERRTRHALQSYDEALGMVRGGYLDDWRDVEWAEIERLRLRTLTIGARCRAGELVLALGEPEHAAAHAGAVLAVEPLQERAARLLAHAASAQGDRATARRVIADLIDRLDTAGLPPEPDTTALARTHGVA